MAMPTTRRDRWLALALLLAVIALAYLVLVHPWFTRPLLAINTDITDLQERDQRVQAQLQQRGAVARGLQQAQAALAGRPGFLREATAESAAAALSSRLQDAVASASPGNRSCTISNRSPLQDTSADAVFPRVALQVRLRCGIPEMAAVLYTLETGSPRLFVNNLNLLAQRFQQSPNETGTGLDVSFELVGYLQPGGAADPVAPAPTGAALPADGSGLTPAGLVPADAQAAADARTDANANAAAYAAQAAEDAAATATNAADAAADAAAAAEADHED
ncbi:type II secretion system protein GspM [Stenotrophomonas rhizophila]|nr:type II secretion system protein GspM [Stenotrophomonas rhizophila]TKK05804.1 general secretion pathway protein GspM [Stenotrophomonas rhizophila]